MENLTIFLQAQPEANPWSFPIMIIGFILIFYFFMIRPQTKKQKELKKFREGLQNGDKVITIGGIHGKVADMGDTYLIVEIDTNVKIKIDKNAVVADFSDIANKK